MKNYVNLMSEGAQFAVAARTLLRVWALVLATVATLLAPVSIWHWQECRRVRQEHEALEASYEPIRRLNMINVELRNKATALVRDERLPLELSRRRPAVTLLGVASAAARQSDGALFIEHIRIEQSPPGAAGVPLPDRLVIETACTLKYDIANFVNALKVAPVADVKIAADEIVTENGVDRKNYTVECALGQPTPGEAAHVN